MSTSLRGRELKCLPFAICCAFTRSTSLRGRELKYTIEVTAGTTATSTSLRGRELKWHWNNFTNSNWSRPPCEVVSWNKYNIQCVSSPQGRPPCEVVSWNAYNNAVAFNGDSRPPCEVVSWNMYFKHLDVTGIVDLLARSWVEILDKIQAYYKTKSTSLRGRELKSVFSCRATNVCTVDLLARSWVEIERGSK